jgi:hypothetical protein
MQLCDAYSNKTVNLNRANFKQLSFSVQTKEASRKIAVKTITSVTYFCALC